MADTRAIAERLAQAARRSGAGVFDVLAVSSRTTGIGVRGGELEDVESSGGTDIGLRVILDGRQAVVSGSDVSETALQTLADRAVAMAKAAPVDPYAQLAPQELLATECPNLDLADPGELDAEALKSRALRVEAATLAVPGVAQAEGASASTTRSEFRLLTSHGFDGGWESTRNTIGVGAYAERDGQMERDYDHHGQRHLGDLPSPEEVGTTAGERAVRRLGARQMASGAMPVLLERRVARSMLGALLSAVSGPSIARGTSFLKDRRGERIFPEAITLRDDPLRVRGLGSRPFDAEGIACHPLDIVKDGVLNAWLLNLASAKKLGLETTGRAHRGVGSPPGVSATNLVFPNGARTPDELRRDMGEGLQITEMFGPSLNANTGDYSVGVAGFAIEGGEVAYPVSEITIAGNLLEVWASVEAANDLRIDGAVVAPSLRVEGLTVAGA